MRSLVELHMKDGTTLTISAVARQINKNWWQGGFQTGNESPRWMQIYGESEDETLDNLQSMVVLDAQDGHLVIKLKGMGWQS